MFKLLKRTIEMNIYVGNLSYRMNDKELETVFAKFGEVKSAKVIMDKETGRSKGFAFVDVVPQLVRHPECWP